MGELLPLAAGGSGEGRALCEALRELFAGLNVSVRRYAARRHRDPGSVSRFLSGGRIPPWEFVVDLLRDVAEMRGAAPTPEAIAMMQELHRNALKASASPAHAVQLLQGQLAEADREARAIAVQQQALTEALQERQHRIADLQVQLSQAEAARGQQVGEMARELELQHSRYSDLKSERDRLQRTVDALQAQLNDAAARHLAAEERCEILERQLAALDGVSAQADVDAPSTGSQVMNRQGPEKAKILVIDSSRPNLLAYEAILEPLSQDLVLANSGTEGIELSRSASDVCLIILAAETKDVNAFEVLANIKRRIRTRDIPVILVSSSTVDPHETFRAYAAGAVDFLHKPIDPWVLRAKVAVFVELFLARNHLL